MSPLPPPTGSPVPSSDLPDPWAEQERRRAEHRARIRRRRLRWIVPLTILGLSAGSLAVGVAVTGVGGGGERTGSETSSDAPPTTASSGQTSASTDVGSQADQLIEVQRVWLIDRGDATYDWGVTVRAPTDAPTRSGVLIEVRLLDADDRIVEESFGVVDGVGSESEGAVAGRLDASDGVPVRLEFDVAIGVESNDRALGDVLSLRAVERSADSIRGRIRSVNPDPVEDIGMVLLWFDDDGEVVAAVPQAVALVRPDVEALFDIDLTGEVVPEGRPGAVVWTS